MDPAGGAGTQSAPTGDFSSSTSQVTISKILYQGFTPSDIYGPVVSRTSGEGPVTAWDGSGSNDSDYHDFMINNSKTGNCQLHNGWSTWYLYYTPELTHQVAADGKAGGRYKSGNNWYIKFRVYYESLVTGLTGYAEHTVELVMDGEGARKKLVIDFNNRDQSIYYKLVVKDASNATILSRIFLKNATSSTTQIVIHLNVGSNYSFDIQSLEHSGAGWVYNGWTFYSIKYVSIATWGPQNFYAAETKTINNNVGAYGQTDHSDATFQQLPMQMNQAVANMGQVGRTVTNKQFLRFPISFGSPSSGDFTLATGSTLTLGKGAIKLSHTCYVSATAQVDLVYSNGSMIGPGTVTGTTTGTVKQILGDNGRWLIADFGQQQATVNSTFYLQVSLATDTLIFAGEGGGKGGIYGAGSLSNDGGKTWDKGGSGDRPIVWFNVNHVAGMGGPPKK
jgi:hypothetical protein